jgi:hypothetical protein
MGVLEELDKTAPSVGVLDVLDGRVPVKGYLRTRPKKPLAGVPLVVQGPGGQPLVLDREMVAGVLPAALGAAGGFLGKPLGALAGLPAAGVGAIPAAYAGGMAGAGLGGAAGELGSQLLMGETPDLGQIARQGAAQGAYEGLGRGIGQGLRKISGPIMQLALRAGPQEAATALREGIRPTKLGVRRLLVKLGRYGAETDRIVAQASPHTRPYDMVQLLRGAYADVHPKVATSMTGDELAALQESLWKFVRQNPRRTATAKQLHALKKAADTAARAMYNTLPKGVKPTPAMQAGEGFYKAFADRARQTLNATVADYEASNAPAEALIRLKDVLVPVSRKEMSRGAQVVSAIAKPGVRAAIGASVGAALPGDRGQNALVGAGVGALGASPSALAGLSFLLSNPLFAQLFGQVPRAVGAAVAPPR